MTPLRPVLVPTLSVLAMLAVGSCGGENTPYARAAQMERLEDGVGGPKAMARPGDFVRENDHIKVAILSARNSLGPGLYGGSLVDADIQRPGAASEAHRVEGPSTAARHRRRSASRCSSTPCSRMEQTGARSLLTSTSSRWR